MIQLWVNAMLNNNQQILFLILMIMHFVADFFTWNRKWGIENKRELKTKKGIIKFITSEWFLALNPLHWLWDRYSPWRRHQLHASSLYGNDLKNMGWISETHDLSKDEMMIVVDWWFWRWLALDQLYHLLSNLFIVILLGVVL